MARCRSFALGDILSVTTGKLVSPRLLAGVSEILAYLTGEAPFTHQLGRFMEECRPHLLRQHPALAPVSGDTVTSENWRTWLDEQESRLGPALLIEPIPSDDHARRDSLTELVDMVGPERVIVVNPVP